MLQKTRFYTAIYIIYIGLLFTTYPGWTQQDWGPNDQRGAANYITETKAVKSARLITEGKIYELGHIYEEKMPTGGATFKLGIIGSGPGGPPHRAVFNDDFYVGDIGHIGTQFDAFGHAGYRGDGPMEDDEFYNGLKDQKFIPLVV